MTIVDTVLDKTRIPEIGTIDTFNKIDLTETIFTEEIIPLIEDQIYNLNEYHDSFIWDYVRKRFEDERGTINYNIGDNAAGHVQARSILAEVYDHTKGRRKLTGKSPEAKI